jgi:hypothetical protein
MIVSKSSGQSHPLILPRKIPLSCRANNKCFRTDVHTILIDVWDQRQLLQVILGRALALALAPCGYLVDVVHSHMVYRFVSYHLAETHR